MHHLISIGLCRITTARKTFVFKKLNSKKGKKYKGKKKKKEMIVNLRCCSLNIDERRDDTHDIASRLVENESPVRMEY